MSSSSGILGRNPKYEFGTLYRQEFFYFVQFWPCQHILLRVEEFYLCEKNALHWICIVWNQQLFLDFVFGTWECVVDIGTLGQHGQGQMDTDEAFQDHSIVLMIDELPVGRDLELH